MKYLLVIISSLNVALAYGQNNLLSIKRIDSIVKVIDSSHNFKTTSTFADGSKLVGNKRILGSTDYTISFKQNSKE